MANLPRDNPEEWLPLLVHAHHRGYKRDLNFWLSLAEEVGEPILELGCGSGRVLIPIAKAGLNAYGLDRNAGMLDLLREHIPAMLEQRVHLIQADLTNFNLAARFALILMPCNTYSTLNTEARRAAIGCIQRHLKPDGIFAASLPNPALLDRLAGSNEAEVEANFHHPQSDNPVQVSSAWVREGDVFTLQWHYDHLLPDGRVERQTVSTRHNIVAAEAYLAEFRAGNLPTSAVYGDFDRSHYKGDAPHLIIVARSK